MPPTDEDLVTRVGAGDEDALRALYTRHVGLVFSVATRVVGADAAEDVVQDVFLALWKKAESFDATRGAFPGWLARIARNRALNENRRRRGEGTRTDEAILEDVADDALAPDEAGWQAHRRGVLKAAIDALPEDQRRAVSLAFLDELPHAEVARALGTPLGTVKTRIRISLKRLAPLLAVLLVVVVVIGVLARRREEDRRARVERALRMVTASDVVPIRLAASPGIADAAHGNYRARPGDTVAVLTTTSLPAAEPGASYVGWAKFGDRWVSFGRLEIGADGRSIAVAEDAAIAARPSLVQVTSERSLVDTPTGPAVISWRAE